MRKICLFASAFFLLSNRILSEDIDQPSAIVMILGPRVGASYVFETPENFTARVRDIDMTGDYFPGITLFGITLEQRILLGRTKSHFALQETVLIGGLEQGIILPEAALLIGYRGSSGIEFGIGPILNFRYHGFSEDVINEYDPIIDLYGIGVVAAIGWTFSVNGVYVPVDISFIIPNSERPAALGITTGFNFITGKSEPAGKYKSDFLTKDYLNRTISADRDEKVIAGKLYDRIMNIDDLIEGGEEYFAGPVNGEIGILILKYNDVFILLLTNRDKNNVKRCVDARFVETPDNGYHLGNSVFVNDEYRENVFAIYRDDSKYSGAMGHYTDDILAAFEINIAIKKIDSISTENLKCQILNE